MRSPLSSRRKLGPEPTTGVAKLRGLGIVLLLVSLKFQSPAKKLEGEGRNSLVMNLLGSAETGVSIRLFEVLEVWLCWETGWCGLAKGLGGPEAPAERRAEAEGEGGGRTTPEPEEDCSWD